MSSIVSCETEMEWTLALRWMQMRKIPIGCLSLSSSSSANQDDGVWWTVASGKTMYAPRSRIRLSWNKSSDHPNCTRWQPTESEQPTWTCESFVLTMNEEEDASLWKILSHGKNAPTWICALPPAWQLHATHLAETIPFDNCSSWFQVWEDFRNTIVQGARKWNNQQHYGQKVVTAQDRSTCPLIRVRAFQNWMKNELLSRYGTVLPFIHEDDALYILDWACGRGGDLTKWKFWTQERRARNIVLVCVDHSKGALEEAQSRASQMHFPAHVTLCFEHVESAFPFDASFVSKYRNRFSLVVCHFALHYAMETHAQWRFTIDAFKQVISPSGARWIATLPHPQAFADLADQTTCWTPYTASVRAAGHVHIERCDERHIAVTLGKSLHALWEPLVQMDWLKELFSNKKEEEEEEVRWVLVPTVLWELGHRWFASSPTFERMCVRPWRKHGIWDHRHSHRTKRLTCLWSPTEQWMAESYFGWVLEIKKTRTRVVESF